MLLSELRENKEYIIKRYTKDNKSANEIGRELYSCPSSVIKILRENGVEIIKRTNRKNFFNEHYFDVLDKEEKFYILGFFLADGNIRKDLAGITFNQSLRDVDILEKIKKEFGSNGTIRTHQDNLNLTDDSYICTFALNSKILVERLLNLGITPNKTLKIKFPQYIPDRFMKDFIRGYFDGDGTFSLSNKEGTRTVCKIIGTKNFCEGLKECLDKKDIRSTVISRKNTSVYSLGVHSQDSVEKFLKWIYLNNNICLERKYKRFYSYFYENKPLIKYSDEKIDYFSDIRFSKYLIP